MLELNIYMKRAVHKSIMQCNGTFPSGFPIEQEPNVSNVHGKWSNLVQNGLIWLFLQARMPILASFPHIVSNRGNPNVVQLD